MYIFSTFYSTQNSRRNNGQVKQNNFLTISRFSYLYVCFIHFTFEKKALGLLGMAKRIIIAVTNDLYTDQRVLRVAQTLMDSGYLVQLVGRLLPGSKPLEQAISYKRFKLWFNKGSFFYANYNLRLFFYLLFRRFDLVLANDLDTLLACFLGATFKRKKIVYDSHEYFTEVPELIDRDFQKQAWQQIESWIVPKLKYAYTVSGAIAQIYSKMYGTKFQVIRNLPLRKGNTSVVVHKNILIYQGSLNVGRGIDLMIQSMLYLPDYQLYIAGSGDIEQELVELRVNLGLEQRVRFLGRLHGKELQMITQQALLGLSLEENMGLNYYFSLPNKLFDYIQARIPVIVSDLPEMKDVVTKYKVGKVLNERTPKALANLVREIAEHQLVYSKLKVNTEIAAQELCWENEMPKLVAVFNEAFETC